MNFSELIRINCIKNPYFSLIIGFMLLGLGFIIINPLVWVSLSAIYGIKQEEITSLLRNTELYVANRSLLLSIIGLTQVFTWGLAGWCMIYLNGEGRYPKVKSHLLVLYFGILMMFASIPLIQVLAFNSDTFQLPESLSGLEHWIKGRESQSFDMIRSFIITHSLSDFLINLLMLAAVPAICEEMFFRGFIQKTFTRIVDARYAVLLGAFIFSFMHFQFFGFFSRLMLGGILGYLFYLTGSIYPGMIAHFAYNGLMVVMGYAAGVTGYEFPDGEAKGNYPWYWVFASVLLTFALGFRLYRIYYPPKI